MRACVRACECILGTPLCGNLAQSNVVGLVLGRLELLTRMYGPILGRTRSTRVSYLETTVEYFPCSYPNR